MAIPNIFIPETNEKVLRRLEQLRPDSPAEWGTMDAAQMLAHLNVAYDMTYGKLPTNYGFVTKLMLKWFVKGVVVGEKPYPKNNRTAPQFVIKDERDFQQEKKNLIANIEKTASLGEAHFEGLESPSFGKLTSKEWSNLFQKHIEHHFKQFSI